MFVSVIYTALFAIGVYALAGTIVTCLLHAHGLKRIDPAVAGAGLFFRALITPGLIAIWPLMLAKLWRAARGLVTAGANDGPVAPHRQRALHGLAFKLLAVAMPVIVGAAILTRAPEGVAAGQSAIIHDTPAALPQVELDLGQLFGGVPIEACIRTDGQGLHQIELRAGKDLQGPALMVYWSTESGPDAAVNRAVYLGSIWSSAVRRFDLPAKTNDTGTILLYAPATADVVATASMKAH